MSKNSNLITPADTSGLQFRTRRAWLAEVVELISSMRFAISLLTLISIASVIGTVLQQNQPMPNYINQFGPFWFELFDKLSLYAVYSAWWFLLIMAFLVVSTTLCIVRNTPKMLKDMRSWREQVREQSLRNFHHKAEWGADVPPASLVGDIARRIEHSGYRLKLFQKESGILISAKRGAANKWGYILAHAAIVIICVGGLLDSDLSIRFQHWFNGKTAFSGSGLISEIPDQHRIGAGNPSFRANAFIPEGATTNTAMIPFRDGVLVQELPYAIELKKFLVEHYSNGMPKLFASEVIVHDGEHSFPARIEVNHPLIYKGLAIYQSSFDDGGSRLKLTGYSMRGGRSAPFEISGEVGSSTPLASTSGAEYTIEWSAFRPFNVENMAQAGQDLRAVDAEKGFDNRIVAGLQRQLGAPVRGKDGEDLRNVGPSVQYKVRDQTGQAREYHNYMLPVEIDGQRVFLSGMRENPNETFRYLRIPADDQDSVEDWMRLRAAVFDPELRAQAASEYARRAIPQERDGAEKLREQLEQSALRGLEIFAGDATASGYMAVSRFLERITPAEQEKAAEVFMKILNGSMWELWQAARTRAGLAPVIEEERNARFLQSATNAISDAAFYGAPVYLRLHEFEEIKASVLQVTRSPGKYVVYFGCLLLTLGVFAMLYIRDRRLWVWVKANGTGGTSALMAFSTQRKTLDFEKEFEVIKARLTQPGTRQQT